jgi:hypothetical protein
MKSAVAMIVSRVVAQHVLLCKVGSDLFEGGFKLGSRFGNVYGAAGLRGKLLHPPLSRQRTQVGAFIQAGLNYEDLTIICQHSLNSSLEIRAARCLYSV